MHCTDSLLAGVSVIEADDQLAMVHFGEVLVEHRSLGVSDVEVTAGLGWEAGHNLSVFRIHQPERETSGGFGRSSFASFGGSEACQRGLNAVQRFKMREPSQKMGLVVVFEEACNPATP